jgi:phage-related protein|nr:MAG TPA: tail tape measure protein [Caudoviricetes sp.]
MASSFGGTVKLTGESEYVKALRNINSNLKAVSSELKLASTEFTNNGEKIGDLRIKNDTLNKKLQEEQNIVKTCANAIKDFTEQQTKNKNEIDKLKNTLITEQQTLEKMKNSTTATSSEISKQEKVIADLEKALSKVEAGYDNNNRKINDYRVKMNNAKSECSDLSKKIQDNNSILDKAGKSFDNDAKSVKDFSTEEEKAGNNALTLGDLIKGNIISEGIIAGIKGLAGAMKTVGSALLDIGKSALNSYADYEQLIGGVETLFKDSAGVVEGYANNAYKTAGLSANQYMETVTSFSASLLQSLNDDTAKSAEVADMAITDMADNANKMGTDMASIQNAYQGFAKQNYTMLDNLKLGYGGTKEEMKRLLKDAQKISGVKYDISNLSDVYNAIHVIQGELGVTGTTAKEASTTIQGSISSMKSSWQNFLTGLASGQDISGLIDNLVQSAVTVMDNVLPVVYTITETIVAEVPNLINKLVAESPKFVELISNTIQTMIVGLQESLPKIMESVSQIIQTIVKVITDNLPSILQMGITILVELANGIAKSLPTLIPQMVDAVITMVDTLLDNIDLIIDAGIQLLIGLTDGLIEALPQLIDRIPQIIDKLVQAIVNNLPKIIEAGITLIIKLAEGLIQAIPQLISKIPQIILSLINGIVSYYGKLSELGKNLLGKVKDGIVSGITGMLDVGKNMVQGLWNGINNAKYWILDKIKGFGKSILNGVKGVFGIHSPSRVFRDEIGVNMAKGIGIGFQQEMVNVNDTIQRALPTDLDLSTKVNLDKPNSIFSLGTLSNGLNNQTSSKVENNTYNFYSTTASPSEYARQIRKEKQYLDLVGA